MSRTFFIATEEEVKNGKTTDIYFERTLHILKQKNISKNVVAEVTCGGIPNHWPWGILLGTEDVATLFEGLPVTVYSLREGTLFRAKDEQGVRTPVMFIEEIYNFRGCECHVSAKNSAVVIRQFIIHVFR